MEVQAPEVAAKATKEEIAQGTSRAFVPNGIVPKKTEVSVKPEPEVKKPEEQAQASTATQTSTAINLDELTEEQVDEILTKRTKGKVKSLKELAEDKVEDTPEQKEAKAIVKKQKALEHALASGKITQADYEKSIIVKGKTNREIALDLFTADAREDNPKITADEAEELFRDYYMEEAEDTDTRRKLRIKEMNRNADRYRAEATSGIDSLEGEYDNYQSSEQRYKAYGTQVDTVIASLPKERNVAFSYDGPNNTKIDVTLPYVLDEADVNSIKKEIRSRGAFANLAGGEKPIKDGDIADLIDYHIRANVMEKVITKVATDAAIKGRMDAEAYYKGIPVRTSNNLGVETEVTNAKKGNVITQEMRDRFPKKQYAN